VQRLHKNIRSTDMIARLGGDEFTMIIENIPNVDFVAYMAKQLCEIVSLPIIINEHPLQVSISIGISIYPLNGLNAEDLLRKADKAMYFAKEHGRNLFHFTAEKI
jgi:diguanylate cyclase (GGDEF)-like protein